MTDRLPDTGDRQTLRLFGRRIFPGLVAMTLIVGGISGLIYTSISQLIASSGWVAHSYQVLDTLDVTENYFTDAQSAERGYVATCKQALITPFRHDVPLILDRIATLRTLTADNPDQQKRVAALSGALRAELSRMTDVIATTLRGEVKSAQSMLVDEPNARATRNVLAIINSMESDERHLLATRLTEVRKFAFLTLIAATAGTIACFAILAFVFWLIRRESRRRAETEASLQDTNLQLEGSLVELEAFNASATTISRLAELLQLCRTVSEALSVTARQLSAMLPEASGTIALYSESRDVLEVVQTIGDANPRYAPEFGPDDCWSLRRGHAHLYDPDATEPSCAHLAVDRAMHLCIPMVALGDALGVMTIGMNRLSERQCQTLQTVAEQISLALANLKLQEKLRIQSVRDQLTGLFNRRYLDESLVREISHARRHDHPVAVVMMDLDHFKRFNDTFGHDAGDALLAATGKLLASQARGEDIACRYGGEEFALILPGASIETAVARADELRREIQQLQISLHGERLGAVTASVGVAAFPTHGDSGTSVVAAADRALYQAKGSGRNRVASADDEPVAVSPLSVAS